MAGVFDLELHDEPVEVDDSDDDVIEIEEVNIGPFLCSCPSGYLFYVKS